MAGNFESVLGTSLAIVSLFASAATAVYVHNNAGGGADRPSILIYDPAHVELEADAYVAAGQDPISVIDAAVIEAVAQGYLLVDSRLQIKGPESSYMRLSDFVEIGGDVGREMAQWMQADPATSLPASVASPTPAQGAQTAAQTASEMLQSIPGTTAQFTPPGARPALAPAASVPVGVSPAPNPQLQSSAPIAEPGADVVDFARELLGTNRPLLDLGL